MLAFPENHGLRLDYIFATQSLAGSCTHTESDREERNDEKPSDQTMRLAWATDIHLNFLTSIDRRRFLESVKEQADALVVTGDIAESNSLGEVLRQMDAVLGKPVYFVLGNHDFYRGSVARTRAALAEMIGGSSSLVYLSQADVVALTPNTALVGHDGWADARLGDFDGSDVILNDFLLINELRHWRELRTLDKPALRHALEMLGDEAARHIKSPPPSRRAVSPRDRRHPCAAVP